MKNSFIENIIKNLNHTYYAHTKASSEKELLASHLELTYKYYERMEKEKNLDVVVKNIIKSTFIINEKVVAKIYVLFKQAIYYHDIGKINPLFQKNKMDNDLNIKVNNVDDTHSALSARIYIDSIIQEIRKDTEYEALEKIAILYAGYYFGYIISRHHSKLESIGGLLDSIKNKEIPEIPEPLNEYYDNNLNYEKIQKVLEKLEVEEINLYILCKLLYSCIITADFYATYDYMSGKQVEFEIEKDNKLFNKYEEADLIKNIRKYEKNQIELEEINMLRSDIFLETEGTLKQNLDKNIFYLEAPTGSGKTNMAINLARILYKNDEKIKTIHYIFPFNNIIEQTDGTFQKYFDKYKDHIVVNSISSINGDKDEIPDYDELYMKYIFNQYPIVITSHINLFNTFFGVGKENNYNLYNYINSVVILDEIQAYSNSIWREMIEMFVPYSELLNIKFIIMSATLPRLDKLLDSNISSFCPLIKNVEKYYNNPCFKNRVKLNYSLLSKNLTIEELINQILKHKNKKVLIECIKKDTAENLYEKLKQQSEDLYIMTGDDNKYNRQKIIEKTKNNKSMFLVATQTIEAGVDIDMDIGFKDISFLDGEEQFIGRINRSNKKRECEAYFFNLDDARIIYRKDKRIGYGLDKEESRQWLQNKSFDLFYEKVLNRIKEETEKYTENNFEEFKKACKFVNYKKVEEKMKLIKNDTVDIFINYTINIDGQEIEGKKVFEEYMEIYNDEEISYSERKIRLSHILEKLNLFTYSIHRNQLNLIEGERILGFYYVEDGEKYIEDGRFCRSKYLGKGEELFL